MDRFTHIDRPSALPGCCVFCGKAADPNGFVDTSTQHDFHGALQVCYSCVKAMYAAFGFDATARQIISEENVANVQHLADVVKMFEETTNDNFKALVSHVSGLDRSFVRSHEVLVQAAGAREAAIIEGARLAAESLGLNELGLDLDDVGSSTGK